ncbi:small ribosomal subunit protein uS14-like [Hylobates moloch]|nr:small ribosomal subunit protein uS14-like [Hylobates moloch]
MGHQQLSWSHPKKFGQGSRSCHYGLNMCCQCFHQYAEEVGFIRLD